MKTKTTDDKHDKHSNQEFYSATSMTVTRSDKFHNIFKTVFL